MYNKQVIHTKREWIKRPRSDTNNNPVDLSLSKSKLLTIYEQCISNYTLV